MDSPAPNRLPVCKTETSSPLLYVPFPFPGHQPGIPPTLTSPQPRTASPLRKQALGLVTANKVFFVLFGNLCVSLLFVKINLIHW